MEDYDPTVFRRNTGDVLAAWAVCSILITGILFGSFINSSADHDEQNVPVAAGYLQDVAQLSVPAHKGATSCE